MINPLQVSLNDADDSKRHIIVEPVLKKQGNSLIDTGVYKLYKDGFGEESVLFTEPLEIEEQNTDLADNMNPDYLGKITLDTQNSWKYEGDLLSAAEQEELISRIKAAV